MWKMSQVVVNTYVSISDKTTVTRQCDAMNATVSLGAGRPWKTSEGNGQEVPASGGLFEKSDFGLTTRGCRATCHALMLRPLQTR